MKSGCIGPRPWVLLWVSLCGLSGVSHEAHGTQVQNIAKDRPYTLLNPPKYAPCTDDGDKTDLTDGKIFEAEEMWGHKGTVGFSARRDIHITIDLGRVEPIMGAALHGGAGTASAMWPISIAVLVSEDGKDFYFVGDLVRRDENTLPKAYQGYEPHWFRTTKLTTKGRYVRVIMLAPGEYAFADEIEVYRGEDALLATAYPVEPVTEAFIKDPGRLTRNGCYRRIRSDLEQVRARVRQTAPPDVDQLLAELGRIQGELDASRFPYDIESFKAVVPVNELHARVFSVYSRILPRGDASGLSLWHTPRYQILSLFETPATTVFDLNVYMARNERRADVFNVTNTTGQARAISFHIDGLPGGTSPDYIKPHQVEYVDGREGEVVASALVPLATKGGVYTSTVPSGMTRQIWLSFDWPQIEAGRYQGKIVLRSGSDMKEIALNLTLAPVRLPDRLDCDLGMWDYVAEINRPRYGVTEKNRPDVIADMREHKLNVVWGEWGSLPQIKGRSGLGKVMWDFDEEGKLNAEIDYSGWDAFVKKFPHADYYFLAHPFGTDEPFGGHEQGTESFHRAVAEFAAHWAEHNRELGLKPRQAGIIFIDEPSHAAMYKTTYVFAKAVKAGTDEILIYCDPMFERSADSIDDIEYAREALELCDVLCPNLSNGYIRMAPATKAFFRERQAAGALFWFYQCHGPTRLFNPSYFRLQAWHCLRYGATGVNFWAYSCLGAMNGWNEYPGFGSRTDAPPYFSPDTVTTSKHWEAVLESRQDYQYVKMLEDRVEALTRAGQGGTRLAEARPLAETLTDSVLDGVAAKFGSWYSARLTDNPSVIAEEGRLRALAMLSALEVGEPAGSQPFLVPPRP